MRPFAPCACGGKKFRDTESHPWLILDIGSGTQDALLYFPDLELENCPKFILPAPAKGVAKNIRKNTEAGNHIFLSGRNMGGGFVGALKEHLERGLNVSAMESVAYAVSDDLSWVRTMGVTITETRPQGSVEISCLDFNPDFWGPFLSLADLPWPEMILAAAQDHGFHPGSSNRRGRFQMWERFLQSGGEAARLLHDKAPSELTRLQSLQECTNGGPVADTGAAALLGALFVPEVEARQKNQGITVVNVGNSHTVAFLVYVNRVFGVYEQHTGLVDRGQLVSDLRRFQRGELSNEEVFEARGHGCMVTDLPVTAQGFEPMYILGPRRSILHGTGEFLAPGGDMMLAGCFGLLKAISDQGRAIKV